MLAEMIEREVDNIVNEWAEFARAKIPKAADLSLPDLRDHARMLLLAVVADLKTPQDDAEQHDKSRGGLPANSPQVTKAAHEHARHRFDQRFSQDELLSEIRALRASVLRRWVNQRRQFNSDAEVELIRFGEAIDQALTEAVAFFGARVHHARELLLGMLGHDIRSPLGAIRMSAQLLERTKGLDERLLKVIQRILNSSDTMRAMVDDLLDFTQTSLGMRLPVTRAPCDLNAVCAEAVAELQAVHPEREVQLLCNGDLTGKWDSGRVGQLISNLVRNAIQHGNALPVTVTLSGNTNEVRIDVLNQGRPIRPESRATLFEPLGQMQNMEGDRHSGSSGLGLGLYIARQIAEAHEGSLDVISSDESGTTFTARLHR